MRRIAAIFLFLSLFLPCIAPAESAPTLVPPQAPTATETPAHSSMLPTRKFAGESSRMP